MAEEGFSVLREALRRAKRLGIGRVVINGKERLLALKPLGWGLLLFTLRYAAEVQPAALYFEDLAEQQVDAARKSFSLSKFEDFDHTGL